MMPKTIGRYDIKGELSAPDSHGGGVYHAYDPRFKRDIAIKLFARHSADDADFRTRFENEADIITALEHPAIVPVYDSGEADGLPFLVMRLMLGGSLALRVQRGPLLLSEAARLFARIAPALDEAHGRGILHLDLKPENILFDQRGDAYLTDFGMDALADGERMSTSPYLSPEQWAGEPPPDRGSDIYALGVILLEMLSGKTPRHMGNRTAHLTEGQPPLPPGCKQIVERATAIGPAERYETVGELAAALTAVADASAEAAPEATLTPERTPGRELSLTPDFSEVTLPLRSSQMIADEKGSSARILLAQLKAEIAKLSTPTAANANLRVGQGVPTNVAIDVSASNPASVPANVSPQANADEQPSSRDPQYEEQQTAHDSSASEEEKELADAAPSRRIEPTTAVETAAALAEFEATRSADEQVRQFTLLLLKFTQAETHSRWVEMIDTGEQLLKLDPQQSTIRTATARAYKSRGTLYHYQRNFVLAIADQSRAIELDPRQPDYYYKRGLSYQGKGNFERALADFTRATELAPDFAEYFFARGAFYLQREEFGRAADDFTRAINLNGGEARYYAQRGMLYCRQHSARLFGLGQEQLERALDDFNHAIGLDYKDAASYAYRAGVYQLKGEGERAMRDISRAIELEPQVATYYYVRGTLYKERGDRPSALRNFARAAELGDANARRELQPPQQVQATPSGQRALPKPAARRTSNRPLSMDPSLTILLQRAGRVLAPSLGLIFGILIVYFCLKPWFGSYPGDGTDVLRWLFLCVGLFLAGHSAWTLWKNMGDGERQAADKRGTSVSGR